MKKNIFLLCLSLFFKLSPAQSDSADFRDYSLYLYRTEEDFFSKKKAYRGQYIPSEDRKLIPYKTLNSKKRVLNLEDSCMYYFGYQIGDETQIRPDKNPGNFSYYTFGGGSRNFYCVVYGQLPNYDRKGYLLGLTSPASVIPIYFVDKVNNLYMVQLNEFLKSTPRLLEQYKAEKAGTDKEDWDRNKLATSIRYLKLFIAQHK